MRSHTSIFILFASVSPSLTRSPSLRLPSQVYDANTVKYRTNVWQKKSPVHHFIYRFSIFFASHSQKDWGKHARFVEYILVHDADQDDPELKLQDDEKWVLQGLMAIRGSRNGVFFINAIAMCIWRVRAVRYLEECERLKKSDNDGGFTRRYLIECGREDVYVADLHTRALVCLTFFYPFMAAIHHVDDIYTELPDIDQAFYQALVDTGDDVSTFLQAATALGASDDAMAILPAEYNRVKEATKKALRLICKQIAVICWSQTRLACSP